MSAATIILWGINRPDGTAVSTSTTQGSAFWTGQSGHYGFPVERRDCAEAGAEELTAALVRLGVPPEAAEHETCRIVITTTIERQSDWPHNAVAVEGDQRVCTCGAHPHADPDWFDHAPTCPYSDGATS